MATTGAEISKIFDQKVGQAYTGYLDNTKKTRLLKEALFTAIENKYKSLSEQKQYDELYSVIKTEVAITPSANKFYLTGVATPVVADYLHLMAIRVKFTQSVDGITIAGATNKTPIVITTSNRTNFRSGEQLTISGVLGNTSANGTFYIRYITDTTFALYSNEKLTTAIAGNAEYISGGVIGRVYYEYAKPLYSDRKIGSIGAATIDAPKYEIADGQIKIYPETETAQEATIDYIKKPTVFINTADASVDLELTYPLKFIYYIVDIARVMFAEQVRDTDLYQQANIDTLKNP